MSEAKVFQPGSEIEAVDPNKKIIQISQLLRRGYNNLLSALENGGQTIPVANYELSKDDKEFPPEEPTSRDLELSADISAIMSESTFEYGGNVINCDQAAKLFLDVRNKANGGEADGDDAQFAERYKEFVIGIYAKLPKGKYSEKEVWT